MANSINKGQIEQAIYVMWLTLRADPSLAEFGIFLK